MATQYRSLGGLMQMLLDPARPDGAKQREVGNLGRPGGSRLVGPAAGKRLLELLTCTDPDKPVNPKD